MKFPQPSLSGGELSPGMRGRTDLARFPISLGVCRNVITKPTGGAAKRPGTIFRGEVKYSDRLTRLIPFIYSTQVRYLIEMGDQYMRFWVDGALLRDGSNNIVEVATPYGVAQLGQVRFTQSADVMYLVHGQVAPKELRRLTATSFELRDFAFSRGPFREVNANDSLVLAASASYGQINITGNANIFTINMVGSLIYLEEQELRGVKPWASAERNCGVGALRRSDSKVYRCVSVPSMAGLTSKDNANNPPYYVCGNSRPVHDSGRDFDGPQDKKNDGVADYRVGVEWEFQNNTFGVARITGYVSPNVVTATVIERLPDSATGVAPTPGNSWAFTGDGSTRTFPITGAIQQSTSAYAVTINGAPVASNPGYGGDDGGSWCVDVETVLPDGRLVADLVVGDQVPCWNMDPSRPQVELHPVLAHAIGSEESFEILTSSGVSIIQSRSTPMVLESGETCTTVDMLGKRVLVMRGDSLAWESVVSLSPVGMRRVVKMSLGDRVFFAGRVAGQSIATHNAVQKP